MVLVLLIAVVAAGSAFAIDMSAGIGGNFGIYNVKQSHPDFDTESPDPIMGGGVFAFFDASYVMVKLGMYFDGSKTEVSTPELNMGLFTTPATKVSTETTNTYLSIGLLGKIPFELGSVTLFPMLGFEYNMYLSGKYSMTTESGSTKTTVDGDGKRGDVDEPKELDMFILQLGCGLDINLTDTIYLRPIILWGIDLTQTEAEKDFKDNDGKTFKHKFDFALAVGFKL
jgi:hypothetical protein